MKLLGRAHALAGRAQLAAQVRGGLWPSYSVPLRMNTAPGRCSTDPISASIFWASVSAGNGAELVAAGGSRGRSRDCSRVRRGGSQEHEGKQLFGLHSAMFAHVG
jgi:hypothetical protein